jgi:hypothetical protein
MLVLQILSLFGLTFVVYQDFKYRGVYWICFPVLAVLLSGIKILGSGLDVFFTDGLITISFLLLQLFVLWGYFAIKHSKIVNLTKGHIGWGDLLFLLVMCLYLSPVNFILFYILSLSCALLFALFINIILNRKSITIPLAGIQALLFVGFLTVEWFFEWNSISLLYLSNVLPN